MVDVLVFLGMVWIWMSVMALGRMYVADVRVCNGKLFMCRGESFCMGDI